jgi:MinD-like ATPase involved in chromosome partitioning or flagellar assembly
VKGGSGTTVVAAALGLLLANSSPDGALLVDLAGDAPAALGVPEPSGPGISEWIAADHDVDGAALDRIAVDAGHGLRLVARGTASAGRSTFRPVRVDALARILTAGHGPAVADAGVVEPGSILAPLIERADSSLLVLRPCYLALRRAANHPLRPGGIVLVTETGRALSRADVEAVLGAPVRASIPVDPVVARAVDAGLLAGRLPRPLRALRSAA